MFSSSLTIADEANAAKSFVLVEQAGQRTRRIDAAGTLALPLTMVISHNQTGSEANLADRHLVQFAKANADANGNVVTTVLNLTISVPRSATAGNPEELIGYLINFLIGTDAARTLANVDNLLLGES